ncbi:hypothetical protein Ciccas_012837, partial [Cichlidogyrus casuarinus]
TQDENGSIASSVQRDKSPPEKSPVACMRSQSVAETMSNGPEPVTPKETNGTRLRAKATAFTGHLATFIARNLERKFYGSHRNLRGEVYWVHKDPIILQDHQLEDVRDGQVRIGSITAFPRTAFSTSGLDKGSKNILILKPLQSSSAYSSIRSRKSNPTHLSKSPTTMDRTGTSLSNSSEPCCDINLPADTRKQHSIPFVIRFQRESVKVRNKPCLSTKDPRFSHLDPIMMRVNSMRHGETVHQNDNLTQLRGSTCRLSAGTAGLTFPSSAPSSVPLISPAASASGSFKKMTKEQGRKGRASLIPCLPARLEVQSLYKPRLAEQQSPITYPTQDDMGSICELS